VTGRVVILLSFIVILILVLSIARDRKLTRQVENALASNEELQRRTAAVNANLEDLKREVAQQRTAIATALVSEPANPVVNLESRIASIESELRSSSASSSRPARMPGRSVPEYDPLNPPVNQPAVPLPEIEPPVVPRRGWGEEQVVGAPDTEHAADVPTAWAAATPDAGAEWLSAAFEQEVEIAEVRIRETFNPGAISKVSALVNGQELVLWEGIAESGQAPRDFVVRPTTLVRANQVAVFLDTTRVSGWNELDAVELVGRDGSRQWASSAAASSSFADRSRIANDPTAGYQP
jgi:hypothetical protein